MQDDSMSDAAPTPEEPPAKDSADDVKARFKQALDRKQGRHKNEHLHPEGDSALHDTHGRSGGKRKFRRKAGG
jgi:hypothetical protein